MSRQITNSILMVKPFSFGFNAETGLTNAFQKNILGLEEDQILNLVHREFDSMVKDLQNEGIDVLVIEDNKDFVRPDAIFPNNWITMHSDGLIVTYPLQSKNRRLERREDIIETLEKSFVVEKRLSLEIFEVKNQFLEGTGSMIFDHEHKIIYACLSPRTDVELLLHFADLIRYTPVYFNAFDKSAIPIYHTNVMMALGLDFVIVCLDSISEEKRLEVLNMFEKTKKEVINISFDQMSNFAGNMLQLLGRNNRPVLVMSQKAFNSLQEEQIFNLTKKSKLLPVKIDTIETIGGGSARCMMAEIFLSKK